MHEERPELSTKLNGTELQRWYWLKSELLVLARELGVSTTGGKLELTERIAARLDGRESVTPSRSPRSTRTTRAAARLPEPLSRDTVIPQGQRSSQQLRAFFEAEIGPGFHFDSAMRAFLGGQAGATLGDAIDHWHDSRGHGRAGDRDIEPQFELNRFTRQWHLDHPDGTPAELRMAWQRYRSLPHDARPRA